MVYVMMTTTQPTSFPAPCCTRCDRGYDAMECSDLCGLCSAADQECPCCGGIGQQVDGNDCACLEA